jgi:hypothetical protein
MRDPRDMTKAGLPEAQSPRRLQCIRPRPLRAVQSVMPGPMVSPRHRGGRSASSRATGQVSAPGIGATRRWERLSAAISDLPAKPHLIDRCTPRDPGNGSRQPNESAPLGQRPGQGNQPTHNAPHGPVPSPVRFNRAPTCAPARPSLPTRQFALSLWSCGIRPPIPSMRTSRPARGRRRGTTPAR